MFSESQSEARKLKLDIVALAEHKHRKLGRIHHMSAKLAKRAEKISNQVDMEGAADEEQLKELQIMFKHIRKWAHE